MRFAPIYRAMPSRFDDVIAVLFRLSTVLHNKQVERLSAAAGQAAIR